MKQTIRVPGKPRTPKNPRYVGITFDLRQVQNMKVMAEIEGVSLAEFIRQLVAVGLTARYHALRFSNPDET